MWTAWEAILPTRVACSWKGENDSLRMMKCLKISFFCKSNLISFYSLVNFTIFALKSEGELLNQQIFVQYQVCGKD